MKHINRTVVGYEQYWSDGLKVRRLLTFDDLQELLIIE